MTDRPPYGSTVRVISGPHTGARGVVTGYLMKYDEGDKAVVLLGRDKAGMPVIKVIDVENLEVVE